MEQNNFTIQTPIKPKDYGVNKGIIYITQGFGENALDYSLLGLKGHNGIDFRTIHCDKGNAWVIASHEGTIISDPDAQSDTAGRYVKILSDEVLIDGQKCKVETIYFHLKSCKHPKGTKVVRGQLIGISDNTGGFSTGPHLHFGFYILWKRANGTYTKDNNGYGGAVDPMPYLIDGQVYQKGDNILSRKFYYNGREIPRNAVNALIPKQYV